MNLIQPGYDWYADYVLNERDKSDCQAVSKQLENYKDGDGFYKISPAFMSDLLLPLVAKHYRFEPDGQKWYKFNGTRLSLSRELFTDIKDSLDDCKNRCAPGVMSFRKNAFNVIYQGRFLPNVIEILQKSYTLHISIKDFDKDPLLLNTPDGTYNLLTGDKEPNRLEDYCRFITAVAPLDDEDGKNCPYYMQHLRYMTQNNQEDMNFLEQISGYITLGQVIQLEFYWLCGISESGKSQLTIAWREILGGIEDSSYYINGPTDLFSKKQNQPHTELWHRIIGKRFMLIDEPADNRVDEARLKEYLSGNPVAARALYGATIGFIPRAKPIFLSNKEPILDAADSGTIRRLNLYDCQKQIPVEKIDNFGETILFQQEGPYILNRMIKAAKVVMMNRKVFKPQSVIENRKEYIQENNLMEAFISDACTTGSLFSESYKHLHQAFTLWCNDNGYDCPSLNSMRQTLKTMRFKRGRTTSNRVVLGLMLNEVYTRKINSPSYDNSLNN